MVNAPERGVFVRTELRNIGMVFQSYAVWPHLTVYKNVAFPLLYGRLRPPKAQVEDKVKHALELVKIDHLAFRPATDLSGGQQQRVALARALVTEPEVLLMDEPLSNLDARLRQDMRAELKRINRQLGITCLFVTHDQIEALSLGDIICVMDQGKIVQRGTPEDVYCHPKNAFIADFIGDANSLEGKARGGQYVETELGLFTCQLPATTSDGQTVRLLIRPEEIVLLDETNHRDNSFAGVVVDRSFLGVLVQLEIEVGVKRFVVRCSPSGAPTQDRVLLHFPCEHLRVFEQSTS